MKTREEGGGKGGDWLTVAAFETEHARRYEEEVDFVFLGLDFLAGFVDVLEKGDVCLDE